MSSSTFRRILLATGIAGLISATIIGIGGWMLVGGAGDTVRRSLITAGDSITAASDTVAVAAETLERIDTGLEALGLGLDGAGDAFDDLQPVVAELGRLTGEDVPATIEAIDVTASSLTGVVRGIDTALGALSFFGVDPISTGDLADALMDIEDELRGVPQRLREQAANLDEAAAGLGGISRQTDALAGQIASTRESIADANELVARYEATALDAELIIARARGDLDGQVLLARLLVALLAGTVAMLQLVPLMLASNRDRATTPVPEQPRELATTSTPSS